MNLFFASLIDRDHCCLTESDSKHAIQVLRKGLGDELHCVDGQGGYYRGIITVASPKNCLIRINESVADLGKRSYSLHLVVAPTKNIDRYEWILEKATEIGVDRITPILCDRSERKLVKWERSQRILISAMKQSLKAYLPVLDEMIPLGRFLEEEFVASKFIAHCAPSQRRALKQVLQPNVASCIMIGPEGDFTDLEINSATSKGFLPVDLGTSRLRTETAAVGACYSFYFVNQ